MCQQDGKDVAATVVDHVRPHKGDETLFFDSDNLQSLCAPCHGCNKQIDELGIPQFGEDGLPISGGHEWL